MLVTGAEGFIGRALVAALSDAGHDVFAANRSCGDIADEETWAAFPPSEHVFHLAARSFVPDSWADPKGFAATNVGGTQRALEYCGTHGAHLIFVSAYVYGVPQSLPIGEDDPIAPNNPYAESKARAESLCRDFAARDVAPVTVVRPFNVFGAGQRREFLVPTIIEQILEGTAIRVDDPRPRRDYLHVDDLVAALIRMAAEPGRYRVFNIGSGVSYSVREVIDMAQSVAGTKLPVSSKKSPRQNEIPDVRANIERAKSVLDWHPRLTFAEGIERLLRGAAPLAGRSGRT